MPTHAARMRQDTVAKWHGETERPTHNLRADRCAALGPAAVGSGQVGWSGDTL